MYTPEDFKEDDKDRILALVSEHAFATLVTIGQGLPVASHLPLLAEGGNNIRLTGHMARANEQWKHFQENNQILVIFMGPHAYISPSLYEGPGVPTWNYSAIHMYGNARIIEDHASLKGIVETLSDRYERGRNKPWFSRFPDRLLDRIVGFEITVSRIEAKYKLSQNRPAVDRRNIINNLLDSGQEGAAGVARLMEVNEQS